MLIMSDTLNIRKLLITVILLFLFQATSSAYVLHGLHILKLAAEKQKKISQLKVDQNVIQYINDGSPIELTETLYFEFPDAFRSETTSDSASRILVSNKGVVISVIDGKIASESLSGLDRYKDILMHLRSRDMLELKLTLQETDINLTSLGRYEKADGNGIAFVIGAQYPDMSTPQIWFDKESFLPVKWIISDSTHGTIEFRFLNWSKINDRFWYPMEMEVLINGMQVRSVKVMGIKIDPKLDKQLFDTAAIRNSHPAKKEPEPEIEEKETNDIDTKIKEFEDIIN